MNNILRYTKPAIDSDYGWEHQSLPIGCGWFGANIFGIVQRDRIQITENSLQNPGEKGGLNNFAELYLYFEHCDVEDYQRGLCLNDAVAYTSYHANGAWFRREYFASYPDKTLVIHLTGERPFSFRAALVVPYVKSREDGCGKQGTVTYEDNRAHLRGVMEYYGIRFAGELAVDTDGNVSSQNGICVENATRATLYMTLGTNYELRPEVFLEEDPKKKLRDFDPGSNVFADLEKVLSLGYESVRRRHLEDYRELFGRVELDLGGQTDMPTDQLLRKYRAGKDVPYLEALYFQFGRYLLIASSRRGTLPANLQGVWNVHEKSPWGSGYWHNINVQMNYWPAFSTNLAETFAAYADFNAAFRPKAQILAREYIRKAAPENYGDGNCGWTVGTGVYPYTIEGPGGHSGPGTGGLTSKLFWDHYDFTRNTEILKTEVYPALQGMSAFLSKTVKRCEDGIYRAVFSASPEQVQGKSYYHTVGCAFDQQMIYENGKDYLLAAEILGKTDNPQYEKQKEQLDHYRPIRIGESGQIKEFEEERFYGEIGEYCHRHISQLIGVHPGTLVHTDTPAWRDAARITLRERGSRTTGWALAHRLNAWARLGDADQAYKALHRLLGKRTMDNLWDFHPPFQIDGNFGGTAGIAEMLLQSHEGCIRILPALPEAWNNGSVRGLVARGAFVVDIRWKHGIAEEINIHSKAGGLCRIAYPGVENGALNGAVATASEGMISFCTEKGKQYRINGISAQAETDVPKGVHLWADQLRWKKEKNRVYRLYRSDGDSPDYKLLFETGGNHCKLEGGGLYKLTAQADLCRESNGFVFAFSDEKRSLRWKHWIYARWNKCKDLGWYFCCEMDRAAKELLAVCKAKVGEKS